jgi:hypothetical protein
LGVLGAIDPSRVQPELPRPSPFNYDAQHFLVTLVQEHLVRVLQTASDISQLETTSYALQQALQHFTANRLRVTSAVVQVSDVTLSHTRAESRLRNISSNALLCGCWCIGEEISRGNALELNVGATACSHL